MGAGGWVGQREQWQKIGTTVIEQYKKEKENNTNTYFYCHYETEFRHIHAEIFDCAKTWY